MRFSRNGYYIEAYIKCATCGELIYDPALQPPADAPAEAFCSDWCREWRALRRSGLKRPVLPLPGSDSAVPPR